MKLLEPQATCTRQSLEEESWHSYSVVASSAYRKATEQIVAPLAVGRGEVRP